MPQNAAIQARFRRSRVFGPVAILAPLLGLASCSSSSVPTISDKTSTKLPSSASQSDTIGLIGGERITWGQLQGPLSEAAGVTVLEELALDRQLEREIASRQIQISESDVQLEQDRLARSIGQQADISPDDAARIVSQLRQSRGLGPIRYAAMLRRNAKLRRLVADTVSVPEDEVRRAVAGRFGERVRARVITTTGQSEAAATLSRVQAAGGSAAAFAEEAVRTSTDETAPIGGLIDSMGLADPAYPIMIRQAAQQLSPGSMSGVLALDRGFAIILVENRIPAQPVPPGEEQRAEAALRLRKERVAMDSLARDLVERAGVIVMDESLRWSWSRRSRGE